MTRTQPSWNNGSVDYFFMNNFQGVLTKPQALRKIAELENDDDFQIVTGQIISSGNFLSIHNARGED